MFVRTLYKILHLIYFETFFDEQLEIIRRHNDGAALRRSKHRGLPVNKCY